MGKQKCSVVKLSVIALIAGLAVTSGAVYGDVSQQRQAELLHLLKQDCGSCHGMTLKGGLGPPLLPEKLVGFSVEAIAAVILHGRPTTPMPPWKGILSEADASWLAKQLKNGASN